MGMTSSEAPAGPATASLLTQGLAGTSSAPERDTQSRHGNRAWACLRTACVTRLTCHFLPATGSTERLTLFVQRTLSRLDPATLTLHFPISWEWAELPRPRPHLRGSWRW